MDGFGHRRRCGRVVCPDYRARIREVSPDTVTHVKELSVLLVFMGKARYDVAIVRDVVGNPKALEIRA